MDRQLTVLLVEDDHAACKAFIDAFDEDENLLLIGVTNNAGKAIESMSDSHPDAIILDLELHQGYGNGLQVLQEAMHLPAIKRPYFLVTTNNTSAITYETARQFGADFIMSKHQEGYSETTVLDFLKMMHSFIQTKHSAAAQLPCIDSPEHKEKRIIRRICSEMNMIGISPKAVGYQYLVDAIQITMQKPMQNLCAQIGMRYGKTDASVERAMQNAINKAWRSVPIEELLNHYSAHINSDKGVPTITEFVCYYANKIKISYE